MCILAIIRITTILLLLLVLSLNFNVVYMAYLLRLTIFRPTVKVRFLYRFSICLKKLQAFKGNLEAAYLLFTTIVNFLLGFK